jgi:hypothetical protein
MSFSISRSVSASIFLPVGAKILMPLSSNGLCDALMTIPASKSNSLVKKATPGVVMICADSQCAPSDAAPS